MNSFRQFLAAIFLAVLPGAILAQPVTKEQIKGLTTAASIWATAAIGITAGWGHEMTAVLSAVLALVILAVLPRLEARIERKRVIEPGQDPGRN